MLLFVHALVKEAGGTVTVSWDTIAGLRPGDTVDWNYDREARTVTAVYVEEQGAD